MNKLIWSNCLLDGANSVTHFLSIRDVEVLWTDSILLCDQYVSLPFWNTPAGQDWLRLNVGCMRIFFFRVAVYLIMYRQLLSCCISPASSAASCHRIISQCLWLRPNVKPLGTITVSQFTWGRSQTAFHQHKREKLQDRRDSIMAHFVLTLTLVRHLRLH